MEMMDKQKRLLETAISLISQYGYNNISVSRICRETGVAKGTFYLYFNSKADILNEILSKLNDELFGNIIWNTAIPASEQLLEYTHEYLTFVDKNGPDFSREILKVIIDERPTPDQANSNMHVQRIENILTAGVRDGSFRDDIDIKHERFFIQSLLFGIIIFWCETTAAFDLSEHGLRAVESYLRGLVDNKKSI